ncbi:hypothetical protein HK100_004700 [Physocladia obscura]|uniref:BZIP domain-containing protein n=1 Tax=Physocladia obscura TaxID=109957 RepID=A0AAD5SU31_9FUNG|nr:hypothetical protein HK100_004700 [Physocladia obscura]
MQCMTYTDIINTGSMDGFDSMDAIGSEQFFVPSLQALESLAAFAVRPNKTEKINKGKIFVVSAETDDSSVAINDSNGNNKRKKTKKELEREKYEFESGKPKRGRKLAQDEPVSRRLAQNRAAQRTFRERKVNQVKTLETRVAELEGLLATAISAASIVVATAPAVDRSLANEIVTLKALVVDLEERNNKLEAEAQQLRQMVFAFNPQRQQQLQQQHKQHLSPFLAISPSAGSFPFLVTSTTSINDFMVTAFSFDSLLAPSPSTIAPPTATSNATENQNILFDTIVSSRRNCRRTLSSSSNNSLNHLQCYPLNL